MASLLQQEEKLTLKQLNELPTFEFHQKFINVIECWPEGAIYVSALSPFHSIESLLGSFDAYLEQLNIESKQKILKLHPDLAGKLADEGGLTIESTFEQSSAGLDKLSKIDKTNLTDLNEQYKTKFGFPFVICVRENKAEAIFNGITQRLKNEKNDEIQTGINEVKKICRLRIKEIVN